MNLLFFILGVLTMVFFKGPCQIVYKVFRHNHYILGLEYEEKELELKIQDLKIKYLKLEQATYKANKDGVSDGTCN